MNVRVAIALAYFVGVAAYSYGAAHDIDPPGILYDIWYGSAFPIAVWALSVPVAFVVRRAWVLLGAGVPVVVAVYLQLIGHKLPWHDAYDPLNPLLVIPVALLALGLAVGLVASWALERSGRSAPQRTG